MIKALVPLLVLLTMIIGGSLYNEYRGEIKVSSGVVRSSAFEAGEVVTVDVTLSDSYHLVVIFDGKRERELIKVDERTYLNVITNERYYFACRYGAFSKGLIICKIKD